MTRSSPVPLLVPVALLCLCLVAGEGWALHRVRLDANRELAKFRQKKLERDSLEHLSPALSPENETAVAADLEKAVRKLGEWRSVLQGDETGRPYPPPPVRPIDAFFELTDLVGQLRAKAGQAQVEIRPGERFGFARYANEGPNPDQIASIYRQSGAIKSLIEVLLESHPQALLGVRRERPATQAGQDRQSRPDDFFEMDHALSVRRPGLVECEAFRLEFTGQTGVLRTFLTGLAHSHLPFVVRGVEVELQRDKNAGQVTAAAPQSNPSTILVKPGISRFGVTVELARLASNPTVAR